MIYKKKGFQCLSNKEYPITCLDWLNGQSFLVTGEKGNPR